MDPLILSAIAFVAVATLVGAVYVIFKDFGPTKAEDRLQVLAGLKTADSDARGITKDDLREGVQGLTGAVSASLQKFANTRQFFEQADSPVRPETFFFMSLGFALMGTGLAAAGEAPLPLYPVAGLFVGAFPYFWLAFRRKSRFKKFAKQLPDAMELIARALRSGHSLASGLHVVVEEMPPPISTEFGMAYEEQNLGVPIEQALKSMLKRMPNLDLKFFVTAIAIQRQTGGDLAEILDKIGYVIRERFKIIGMIQALTGEGRLSGVVLMAMPIAIFFAVYFLNPDYVMLLFTEELGRKMLAGGAVMQILGAFAIKKIITIKV